MSLTTRVLTGLGAGLIAGLAFRGTGIGADAAAWIEPIGTIWINALRMTILPLVVSLLVVAVVDVGDPRHIGRLSAQSFALFITMLSVLAIATALSGPALYSLLDAFATSAAELPPSSTDIPRDISAAGSAREFLLTIVPSNPIRAAADGALLPVLVFAMLLGLALSRTPAESRNTVVSFFRGLRDATFVLIGWVLALAPIGVFALGFNTTARLGGSALGAIGYYIGLVFITHAVAGGALYALAVYGGRTPLKLFARGVAPAQAVALGSRSSLASLPALIDGAERTLRLPADVTGVVLPLAVGTFKLTSPIYWTLGAMLVARLYGIELGTSEIAIVAGASVLLNAATPGIPSGGLLIQAPVYQAVGLPLEGIGLLIAIDVVPDMFKTAFNVTADMAVAVIVARWST
jgi:Na+/H+-dicarboxylate symporter